MRIIGIEGLGQGTDGPVRKLLDSARVKPIHIFPWDYNGGIPSGPILWVVHSFGATYAFKHARPGDTILALDPRHADRKLAMMFDSLFRYEIPFHCPKGVVVYCFYQRGLFLPGHRVTGGANYILRGVSHMSVPGHPDVKAALEVMLNT